MTDERFEELLTLAKENNSMLKRICAYLDKIESAEHRDFEDMKAFMINCAADILVDRTNRNTPHNNNDQIFFR